MFKDNENQNHFKTYGYVKTPLLNEDEIQKIVTLYEETKGLAGIDKKFFTSIWSDNIEYKEKVDKGLKEILRPALANLIVEFKAVFSNFMVKRSGEGTQLPPHQDWSFVDEPKYDSITVWIPLKKVDKSNGALELCPKSHLLQNYKRARFSNSPFVNELELIEQNYMESIPMQKGEALFVNSRTIHSSPPNLSDDDRIAVSIVVIPENAEMVHMVQDKENHSLIHKLHVTPEFFIKYSCFDYPEVNNQVEEFILTDRQPDFDDLVKFVS